MKVTLEFPEDENWTSGMIRAGAAEGVNALSGQLSDLARLFAAREEAAGRVAKAAETVAFQTMIAKTDESIRQADRALAELQTRIDDLQRRETARVLRRRGISEDVIAALLAHVPLADLRRLAD